jgi:hypothetical protein
MRMAIVTDAEARALLCWGEQSSKGAFCQITWLSPMMTTIVNGGEPLAMNVMILGMAKGCKGSAALKCEIIVRGESRD